MKIYQIEITNYCNNSCSYCPRSEMKRPLGIMSMQTLNFVLKKIENNILRLHHYGESLLDDKLEEKIRFIKERKPDMILFLNTNGRLLSHDRVNSLLEAGIDKFILSYHDEKSLKHIHNIKILKRHRIEIIKMTNKEDVNLNHLKDLGYMVSIKRLRDLGQLKREEILKGDPVERCSFLKNDEVVVLWNGDIVPCCECFDDTYVIGNIQQDNIIENKAFEMCDTCLGYGNDTEETERKEV